MNLTIEIMKELADHLGYDYEELPPERSKLALTVVCVATPRAEFYVVRDYITRGFSPTWKEGIEKCMKLGAGYEYGPRDAQQEARIGMVRAMTDYGTKILKQERK